MPRTKDLFIDIGSNRGIYSIIAVKKYGYKKAIACEPNPDTLKTLRENITQNNLSDKIEVIASGVSDTESKVNLEYDSYHMGGAAIITGENKTLSPTRKIIQIDIRPLDSLIPKDEMSKISFIKIDVEGHEMHVLRGGSETLRSMRHGGMLLIESGRLEQIKREIEPFGLEYNTSFEGNHLFTKIAS
jgi:FkbM family methyltransferase